MGKDGGGGVTSISTLTKYQKKVSKKTSELILGGLGEPLESYEGDIIAPLIPELLEAREFISSEGFDQFDELTSKVISQALSMKPSFDLSEEATTRFFKRAVEAPLLETFQEDILPAIRESSAGLGMGFSSGNVLSTTRAAQRLGTTLTSQLGKMQFDTRALQAGLAESAMSRALSTIPMAESFAQRNIERSRALQGVAAPFQAQDQAVATADYQEWLRTRPEASPWMDYALRFTGQSQMALQQQPQTESPWGAIGSLALVAGGMALGGPVGIGMAGGGVASGFFG